MTINTDSWHFKAYHWLEPHPEKPPSVCGYWFTVLVGVPLCSLLFVALCAMIPIIWIGEKLEEKLKGKSFCPFGRVKFGPSLAGQKARVSAEAKKGNG